MTAELLNTLIEKILIHESVKGEDGIKEQEIDIYYRFIGKIDKTRMISLNMGVVRFPFRYGFVGYAKICTQFLLC